MACGTAEGWVSGILVATVLILDATVLIVMAVAIVDERVFVPIAEPLFPVVDIGKPNGVCVATVVLVCDVAGSCVVDGSVVAADDVVWVIVAELVGVEDTEVAKVKLKLKAPEVCEGPKMVGELVDWLADCTAVDGVELCAAAVKSDVEEVVLVVEGLLVVVELFVGVEVVIKEVV